MGGLSARKLVTILSICAISHSECYIHTTRLPIHTFASKKVSARTVVAAQYKPWSATASEGSLPVLTLRRSLLAAISVTAMDVVLGRGTPAFAAPPSPSPKLGDDEFELTFGAGPLGLDVIEVRFPFNAPPETQSSRIIVDALKPGSQAEQLGKEKRLRPQVLLVRVDDINIEGMPGKRAVQVLKDAKVQADKEGRGLRILFRDPLIFKEKLLNSKEGSSVSTQVGTNSSETLTITTLSSPPVCGAVRSQQGDLLEVKYTGYLASTMEVFDGSSINAQGGFFGDQSLYFVLNQGQRQAPRAWEVGLLGMCIGEKRRLVVPPSLAYGAAGVPKGKIIPKLPVPPNATLIYDVTLVGINGINIPTDDETSLGTRIPYDYTGCKTDRNGKSVCGNDVEGRRL